MNDGRRQLPDHRHSVPFVAGQLGVWIEQRAGADRGVNLQQLRWRHEGRVDLAAMRAAWRELARRHAALRLVVEDGDDGLEQWVEPGIELEVSVAELAAGADGAHSPTLDALCADERRALQSIQVAPLWRLAVVRDGAAFDQVIWTFHHGLADGRSMWELVTEAHGLYAAVVHERGWPRPAMAHFHAAVHALGEPLTGAEEHWRRHLDSAPSPDACWPTCLAGSGRLVDVYRERRVHLDEARTAQLRAWAHARESTLNTVLITAWALVLSRLSGRADVVVGTLRTCRTGAHGPAGFFANVVPMRVQVDEAASVAAVAARIRRDWLAAGPFRSCPLQSIRGWAGASALFHSVVAFETRGAPRRIVDVDEATAAWSGFRLERQPASRVLIYGFDGPRLEIVIGHRSAWVDDEAAAGLETLLVDALRMMAGRPTVLVSETRRLGPRSRERTIESGQGSMPAKQVPGTIHGAFARVAASAPERIALVWRDGEMSYDALWTAAGHIATSLDEQGARPGEVVGLVAERSANMVVAMLGALRFGCAYLPLDPSDPLDRRRAGLALASATRVLVDREGRRRLLHSGYTLIDIDPTAHRDSPPTPPHEQPTEGGADGDFLAYVMLTSGTTGLPKAVAVSHRAVVLLILASGCARFGRDETFLHAAPPAFDASTFEIWGALLHGARVALMPAGPFGFPSLATSIRDFRVSTLWLTAGLFHHVVQERPEMLANLGQLLVGGDVVAPGDVATVRERFPDCRLINGYGPTETTTFATCCDLTVSRPPGRTVPIGPPLGSTSTRVVDHRGRLLPAGLFGELVIGGPRLARGYLGRPALSAERFVPDPWSNERGTRLYRTGDSARFLGSGVLELAGRLDRQVKIRGFRIELDEVEAVLQESTRIRTAVVIAAGDSAADRRLVAYVVPADDHWDERALRRELRARVASYLVPREFVVVEDLPMAPSGKLDRSDLGASTRPVEQVPAPEAGRGATVIALYREILRRSDVGADGDFFDLGGDSIGAMRLAAAVEKRFGVRFPVSWFFDHGRVSDLVALLGETEVQGKTESRSASCATAPTGTDRAPTSRFQQHLAFLDRVSSRSTAYNVPIAFRLRGELSIPGFREAITMLAVRHELLRSRFPEEAGKLSRQVEREPTGHFAFLDLRDKGISVARQAAEKQLAAASAYQFALAHEPPLRIHVFRLAAREWLVLFLFHHIVTDEITLATYFRELSDLYVGGTSSSGSGGGADSFSRFCRAENAGRFADRQAADLAYWREVSPSRTLPELLGHPPVPLSRSAVARRIASVDGAMKQALERLARASRCSLFMVELAVLGAGIATMANLEQVALGVPVSLRFDSGHHDAFGPMIATVPLIIDVDPPADFLGHLARVRRRLLAAIAHPWASLEDIARASGVGHGDWGPSLFCALATPVADRGGWMTLGDLVVEPIDLPATAPKFPASFYFLEREHGIDVVVECSAEALDGSAAQTMVDRVCAAMRRLAERPEATVESIFSPSEDEIAQRVARGSGTPMAAAIERGIPDVFREVAARFYDRPAIVWDGGMLTYSMLAERANEVARGLRSLGVRRGDSVGIALERSPELIVSLVGILAAGGAYVPIAATTPRRRLDHICTGAGIGVALMEKGTGSFDELDVHALQVSEVAAAGATAPERALPWIGPLDRAYVMHTSGSTGTPKAVAISHHGVVGLIRESGCAALGPDKVVLQLSILEFDASTFEIWGALLHGGCLALMPPGLPSLDALAERIDTFGVTTALLPTGLFHVVMQERPEILSGLDQLLVGGDVLSPGDVEVFRAAVPDCSLVNAYGPTEATVIATCCDLAEIPTLGVHVPIGRPIGLTRTLVVDPNLVPVPVGGIGELAIGGSRLANGYLNEPGRTAERFVPDPFGPHGGRLYRTGDLTRLEPDGMVTFLGRLDRQVKIRGFRIELDDVELGIRRCAGIVDAIVVAEAESDGRRLVAYVVPRDPARFAVDTFRRDLEGELPRFMIPQRIVAVQAIALTPSGKLDRKALVPLDGPDQPGRSPPANRIEKIVASGWGRLLEREEVGRDDDFFALGGTSLSLMRSIAQIRAEFEVELPLREVYRRATVRALANAIRRRLRAPMLEAAEQHRGVELASSIVRLAGAEDAACSLLGVHPAGGHLLDYQALAHRLEDSGLAFFGVEAAGWVGGVTPNTVGALAASYLEEARARFPRSMPILLGYCTGGLIALEMAQQLAAAGHPRPAVVLLDTPPPQSDFDPSYRLDPVAKPYQVAAIFGGELRLDLPIDDLRDVPVSDLPQVVWDAFVDGFPEQAADLGFTTFLRLYQTYFANLEAAAGYEPRDEDVDLLILEADESHRPSCAGWRRRFPRASCRRIPGNHFSCLRHPQVEKLGLSLIEETMRLVGEG